MNKSRELRLLEKEAKRRKEGCGNKFLLKVIKKKKGRCEIWATCGNNDFCPECIIKRNWKEKK